MKKIKINGAFSELGTLKKMVFAVRILKEFSPRLITSRIISMFGFWFFTGFIQEIWFLRAVLHIIENKGDFKSFAVTVIIFSIAGVIGKALNIFLETKISKKSQIFYKNLNARIFEKAQSVDIEFFENPEFFDKYKRATEVITEDHFGEFAYHLAVVINAVLTGSFILVYVASVDVKILFILFLIIPVLFFEAKKGKKEIEKDKEMTVHKRSKAYVKRIFYLREYAKDIRISEIYDVLHKRYADAVESNREIIKKYGRIIGFLSTMIGFFGQAFPVALSYIYATYRYAFKKNLALADFSVIMTAMGNLKDVVNDIGEAYSSLRREALYFGNLQEFLCFEPKIVNGEKIAEEFETLEFKNVSFTYPNSSFPSLKGIDFKVSKGETVAVVGHNGAGKSTFVKLLLRFYDCDEGEILYNGVNIKEYNVDSLRKRFSTVFQDYKVFALSVSENILCKEIENEQERVSVAEALSKSGADSFVCKLPKGENTVLTREFDETGVGLSGGEQQKISVARMFAKEFDLAILDEPSSALDPVAEYKMYESLVEATKDKTVVYISHRLSSAVLADNIYVFDSGIVAEKGTHTELMSKNGKYANMFALQASSYKEGGVNV